MSEYLEIDEFHSKNKNIPHNETSIERLSYAQERLLLIDQLENAANVYNIPMYYKFAKGINIEKFKKALLSVIRYQDILRTILVNEVGNVFQKVVDMDRVNDMHVLNKIKVENEKQMNEEMLIANDYVFDLYKNLPIRAHFYYNGESCAHVSIIVHHICFDGWSVGIFERELLAHYKALSSNEPFIPTATITYRDYAAWERLEFTDEKLSKFIEFWQNKLMDSEPLNLPADFNRPAHFDYHAGEETHFVIEEYVINSLKSIAKYLKVSLYR